jgi:hypothetical protein
MKNHLLLPNKCRLIGYILLPFSLAWLIATGGFGTSVFSFLVMKDAKDGILSGSGDFLWSKDFSSDMNLTLSIALTLVCLFMVAFAKEKKEDEYVRSVRMQALQVSVYVNHLVLILATIFVYGGGYLSVIEVNLFTIPIIFILVYNYFLRIKPRLTKSSDL